MNFIGYGGGKINRKVLLSVLLLLSLTLSLNASAVSAVSGNQTSTVNSTTPSTTQPVNTTQNTKLVNDNSTSQLNQSGNSTITNQSSVKSNNISNSNNSEIAAGSLAAETTTTTINVLIYSGAYASASCVNGMKTALEYANSHNLIPGIQFTYATSTVINSAILASYDVLNMPGGSGGANYLNSGSISASAIKSFVSSGKGYIGICAGAYAGAARVDGMYNGWGVAPHVNAKAVSYIGNLSMQLTSAGQQLLGRSGTVNIHHYNGAAMYVTGGNAVIFGTYADSKTGYKGYADIVGDQYGNGRSVLIGSHPELSPQYPDILANLIVWAANKSTNHTPDPDPEPVLGNVTVSQVSSAASSVKSYFETNRKLPNYVTISNSQVTMPQFLYILAKGTLQANNGSKTAITMKNINSAASPSGTFKAGLIQKTEFISMALNMKNFMDTNGRAPNYVNSSLGRISFNSLVYMYSKIMNYYNTNNKLPGNVAVTS